MRGQITIMIIVGFLVLVSFAFVYFLAAGREKSPEMQQTKIMAETVSSFVSECLRHVSANGLDLLGRQGGVIFQSQGGIAQDSDYSAGAHYLPYAVPPSVYKVLYLTFRQTDNFANFFFGQPPKYPWKEYPFIITSGGDKTEFYKGLFGKNKILPLEGSGSMQAQLEGYIDTGTVSCLDWTILQQQGILVKPGQHSADVTFTQDDVTVQFVYELEVTQELTKSATTLNSFITTIPVRMRQIHGFVKRVLDEDSTNILYNPALATEGDIRVQIARDVYEQEDIVKIIDGKSSIDGRQFEFNAGRQNRPPALHYTDPVDLSAKRICTGTRITLAQNELRFDTSICPASTPPAYSPSFSLQLKADDPDDEDMLVFSAEIGSAALPGTAYTVSAIDAGAGQVAIIAKVSDGALNDEQEIIIPV